MKPEDKIANMHSKLWNIALECRKDVLKFQRGNNTAGIRIRAMMQDIRNTAKDIRDEIQKVKKVRKKRKQDAKKSKS